MDKIRYNEEQKAFEITYKLWDNDTDVLLYVKSEQEILENLGEIAGKLDKIDRNRTKITSLIDRKLGKSLSQHEGFEKTMYISKALVDIDEDGATVEFTVKSREKAVLKGVGVDLELSTDNSIEILGVNSRYDM